MSFSITMAVRLQMIKRYLHDKQYYIILTFLSAVSLMLYYFIYTEMQKYVSAIYNEYSILDKRVNSALKLGSDYSLDLHFNNKTTGCQIYKTDFYLEQGGIVLSPKNPKKELLCQIGLQKLCNGKYLAENVELMYAFAPIYSVISEGQPYLYQYHVDYGHYLNSIGIKMPTLEAIFPARGQKFQITSAGKEPFEIQLKLSDPFYIRENLLNVMAKKVPGWEYLLWIDSHQLFQNTYWWEEALYKLEHYATVQLFQYVYRLGVGNSSLETTVGTDPSVLYGYSLSKLQNFSLYYNNLWSGNAWGIRREMYDKIGRILDTCISGCCDCAWCLASMKDVNDWPVLDRWPNYKNELWPWITNTNKVFQGNTAYVRGNLTHFAHEHGYQYLKMLNALTEEHFKVSRDLDRDENDTIVLKSDYLKKLYSMNG